MTQEMDRQGEDYLNISRLSYVKNVIWGNVKPVLTAETLLIHNKHYTNCLQSGRYPVGLLIAFFFLKIEIK